MKKEVLRLRGIEKQKHDNFVLRDVNLQIFSGEIVGLLGLQQTGKNALAEILEGYEKADEGKIFIEEKQIVFSNTAEARAAGIYSLSVKSLLAGNMSVAENLCVLNQKPWPLPFSLRNMEAKAQFTLSQFGLNISPDMKAKHLSKTQQAVLCLIQIVLQNPKLVIIDSGIEFELEEYDLFERMILHFCKAGVSFLVVSNKVSSLIGKCNRIYMLKENTLSSPFYTRDFDSEKISRILTGDQMPEQNMEIQLQKKAGVPLLELAALRLGPDAPRINFSIDRGEICALIPPNEVSAETLGYTIFGMQNVYSGSIYFEGKKKFFRGAKDAMKSGIALIPNDLDAVIFEEHNTEKNLLMPYLVKGYGVQIIKSKFNRMMSEALQHNYGLASSGKARIKNEGYSVSDLLKLSVARWEPLKPQLYVFINPFSVLDEQTAGDMRELFRKLAKRNCGVLLLAPNIYGVKNACTRIVNMS